MIDYNIIAESISFYGKVTDVEEEIIIVTELNDKFEVLEKEQFYAIAKTSLPVNKKINVGTYLKIKYTGNYYLKIKTKDAEERKKYEDYAQSWKISMEKLNRTERAIKQKSRQNWEKRMAQLQKNQKKHTCKTRKKFKVIEFLSCIK